MKSAHLKLALKFLCVGLLFYFLAQKGLISVEATQRALSRLDLVLPAIALNFFSAILACVRWQFLLKAQSFALKFTRVFQLSFIGNFFNLALPGAVSGDLVKAFYVAKETDGQKGRVFGTILFDRVTGVSALALVSAGALLSNYHSFQGTALLSGISFMVRAAALGVITFYTYLFFVREKYDPLLALLNRLAGRFSRVESIVRIYLGLRHYHHQRVAVLVALLISIIIHISACTSALLFLRALGEMEVSTRSVYVVVPLGMLVTAVPILPAGVGTGHAAFGWLFGFLGTSRGADVFSLMILSQLLGGALGGLIYLRFRTPTSQFELNRVLASEPVATNK